MQWAHRPYLVKLIYLSLEYCHEYLSMYITHNSVTIPTFTDYVGLNKNVLITFYYYLYIILTLIKDINIRGRHLKYSVAN